MKLATNLSLGIVLTAAITSSAFADPVGVTLDARVMGDGTELQYTEFYIWDLPGYLDDDPDQHKGAFYHIFVDSGENKSGFFENHYWFTMEFSHFDFSPFTLDNTFELSIFDIKRPLPPGGKGEDPWLVSDVTATSSIGNVPIGSVSTDGYDIFFHADLFDLDVAGQVITIEFTQALPAPGGLALLGAAGLFTRRRRTRNMR